MSHPHGSSGPTTGWFDLLAKLGMIVMALRDRWAIWDVASALLLLGVIGWSWRSPRFSRHSGLALGCVFAGAAFILLPKHIAGTSFVDMRLVPMILRWRWSRCARATMSPAPCGTHCLWPR